MKRNYQYHPVTPQKWDELYDYYLTNKNNPNWFNVILPTIRPYIDMCKKSFKVRVEFWDEYESSLLQNIWRAFNEFKPGRGSKFSTWVYRLAKQSAWGFIKNKCKDTDITMKQDDITGCGNSIPDNETPEEIFISDENDAATKNNLETIIMCVLRGPIEREVYMRKYGIMGYVPQNIETMASELNLTTKTVEQIITRNNNSIGIFKRFLRENNLNNLESIQNLSNIITLYKNTLKKNKTL